MKPMEILKKCIWALVTIFLTWVILLELKYAELWYIPLHMVDSPNRLEDYALCWFSLFCASLMLPLWFFAARKTIRLFMNNMQWLSLAAVIPGKVTALVTLTAAGLMVWQIRESRYYSALYSIMDVPEYAEAAATGHLYQALMWGVALFCAICLLVKQIWRICRAKREH